jgi:hypothetical protein
MQLYLKIISGAMVLISATNIIFEVATWYYVILAVIWCTALQFLLDGVIAIIVNSLPDRWFGVNNKLFRVSQTEKEIYKKLKVKRWKDKVWELGGLGGFSKKNLSEPTNPRYYEKFIIECNKGVLTHRLSYFVGLIAMFTVIKTCAFTIALPVAMVNLFLNILPTIVLRYNTLTLKSLLTRLEKKESNKKSANIN